MARSLPPLTWFRSFEAAARHLNFTAAAAEIGMTQSAVSQQIKALETRLNTLLFHRESRRLSLTDEGRKLLPQVEAALQVLADATTGFEMPKGKSALLTIAASVSVIDWLVSPGLAKFREAFPDTPIRFLSTIWPDDYHQTQADVEIRFGSVKQVGQEARALGAMDLVAVRSKASRGQQHRMPRIEAVGTSVGWARFLETGGAGALSGVPHEEDVSVLYADSYGLALRLAVDGQGIALVPALLAAQAVHLGVAEIVSSHSVAVNEGYFIACRSPKPEAKAFAAWLEGKASPNA